MVATYSDAKAPAAVPKPRKTEGIEVLILARYNVTPGEGPYGECETLGECVQKEREMYRQGVVQPSDYVGFAEQLNVMIQPAGAYNALLDLVKRLSDRGVPNGFVDELPPVQRALFARITGTTA